MSASFEDKLKKALENGGVARTSTCPDTTTIGLYIEGKLPKKEAGMVEGHVSSCLHCLEQILELRELLYYEKKWASVPYQLLRTLENLYLKKKSVEKRSFHGFINSFLTGMATVFAFPFRQWRYAAVSAVSVGVALVIAIGVQSPKQEMTSFPDVNPNAFVQVKALGSDGRIVRQAQGVVLDPQGTIATNLSSLAGAASIQVSLRNGKTYQIQTFWKDDGKNLAVMKVEGESLPSLKIADEKQITVGEQAFVVADPSQSKKGMGQALISDFKSNPGRRGGGEIQYIQFASFSAQYSKGALIDKNGNLIGLVITEEKNVNLATPLKDAFRLVKEQKPMPVGELKNITFSTDALNLYFKGILARNAQKWDEAIELFKKAVELNPSLEDAHVELGFLYYKKRLFDQEREAYKAALKINPANTDTLFYLATNLETRGLYDEATKVFEKIVTLDPEDADSYYELGLAYIARGESAKALDTCKKLQALDPGLAGKLRRIVDGKEQ